MDDFECNKPFNLPSLSPPHSAGSMTIKTVSPFNDDLFQFEEKAVPLIEKSKAVPTASADAAAASLQTAFCRRPSHSLKMNSVLSEPLHHQDQSFAFYDDSKTSTGNNNQFSENNNQAQSEQDGNNDDAQQMEIYRDLILRHLIQDISTTCSKLGLPTDAINWSEEHGSRWINEMCQQFNLNPPRRPFLNGRTLLNMSETEFRNLSPEGGDTLYAQLQLWKTAFETYHDQQCSGQSARMTAADSSTSKDSSNWSFTSGNSSCLTSPIDDNISKKGISNFPRFNGDRTNNAGANGNPPNLCFYNGAQFAGSHIDNNAQSPYFMQRNMSSPCNSEMSSSGSIQELPEDDSKEFPMNFLHMQNDMHFCQQDPANPSDYHMK
ncbi:hypothetical protein WR25_03974 isoform B [Diploscapter pachys]|uniref:PNT domain-containing protein n=1 Tax=Diploscapter pachys TaxID=2018661 RepID=A0A2A2KET6_9BILA|nr:hypothetical protein WR25_03974 isoform B [Diploscapter pachys]